MGAWVHGCMGAWLIPDIICLIYHIEEYNNYLHVHKLLCCKCISNLSSLPPTTEYRFCTGLSRLVPNGMTSIIL